MSNKSVAYFGMGCFWEPDAYFSKLPGVKQTEVGYSGGTKINPTYEDLGDNTETIKIKYDPEKITYKELLSHFFKKHNPKVDQKTQYRSAIFYIDNSQKSQAQDFLKEKIKQNQDIKTKIEKVKNYTKAEEYHQKYLQKNNVKGVC